MIMVSLYGGHRVFLKIPPDQFDKGNACSALIANLLHLMGEYLLCIQSFDFC